MRTFFNDLLQQLQDPEFSSSILPLIAVAAVFFFGTTFIVYRLLMAIRGHQPEEAIAPPEHQTQVPVAVENLPPLATPEKRIQNFFKRVFSRKAKTEIMAPATLLASSTSTTPEESAPATIDIILAPAPAPAPNGSPEVILAPPISKPAAEDQPVAPVAPTPASIPNTDRVEMERLSAAVTRLEQETFNLKKNNEHAERKTSELHATLTALSIRLEDEKRNSLGVMQSKQKLQERAEVLENSLRQVISEVEALHRQNHQIVAFQPISHEFEQLLKSAESIRRGAVTARAPSRPDPIIQAQAEEISKLKDLLVLCKQQILDLSRRKVA